MAAGGGLRISYFNSRPSARGDIRGCHAPPSDKFQFTPLREGRLFELLLRERICYFNSRPSARGDAADGWILDNIHNFNSRPSARGDEGVGQSPTGIIISIHAPPRGATRKRRKERIIMKFQFTPLREGRHNGKRPLNIVMGFQFTPLREGRRRLSSEYSAADGISIHAPPRGATGGNGAVYHLQQFQFTPLREGRHALPEKSFYYEEFQFTPLREGRPAEHRHG